MAQEPVKRAGVHHVGLCAKDYEATVDFYTRVMGWKVAYQVEGTPPDGNHQKHVLFDTGDGSFVAFMCPSPGTSIASSPNWTTDINSGLGVPGYYYHFAFWADSLEELQEKQAELRSRGVEVTEIDYKGVWGSIYFRDPNGLLLEYCVTLQPLTEDHQLSKERPEDHASNLDEDDMATLLGPGVTAPVPT